MDIDGTNLRRLTTNSADDWSPAWSPDGGQIAFHSLAAWRAIYIIIVIDADQLKPPLLHHQLGEPVPRLVAGWTADRVHVSIVIATEKSM